MSADSNAPSVFDEIAQRWGQLNAKLKELGLLDVAWFQSAAEEPERLAKIEAALPDLAQEVTEIHAIMRFAERLGVLSDVDVHALRKKFGDNAGALVRLMMYKRAPAWSFSPLAREHTQTLESALGAFTGASFGIHREEPLLPAEVSPDMEMSRCVAVTLQALRDCLACSDLESARELALSSHRILGSLAVVPLQPDAGRRLVDTVRTLIINGWLREKATAGSIVSCIQRGWPGLISPSMTREKRREIRHLLSVDGLNESCADAFEGMTQALSELQEAQNPAVQKLAASKLLHQGDRLAREIAIQSLVIAGVPVKQAREVYRARAAGAYVQRGRDKKK